jgi:phosphatidylglycerophosphate synthase
MPPIPWFALVLALGASWAGAAVLDLMGFVSWAGVLATSLVTLVGEGLIAASHRRSRLGVANAITLARLLGVSWIAALTIALVSPGPSATTTALIIVVGIGCLALDGVDGRVARARGEASPFGARFDMETDSAMLLVLCIAVRWQGSVGVWVLTIGLLRYVYWLLSLMVNRLRSPLPASYARKTVAVAQGAALLVCLLLGATGFGPAWLAPTVAAAALVGLLWSFGSVTLKQLQPAPWIRTYREE